MKLRPVVAASCLALLAIILVTALTSNTLTPSLLLGVRAEFLVFAVVLIGIALLHDRTLEIALVGLASLIVLKLFADSEFELGAHLLSDAKTLANLFGLLLGFAVLSRHFEATRIPELLPRYLPDDWKGGFMLLAAVFFMSSFLDNIAAAIIGGTTARHVFQRRVDIGYLAAIVAASNAGGSGSVIGDTTTTMLWIGGVEAVRTLPAYLAALPALALFGLVAAHRQHRYQPILEDTVDDVAIHWGQALAVVLILVGAVIANVLLEAPALGVWIAIIVGATFTRLNYSEVLQSLPGAVFLVTLVTAASLLPVESLPPPTWLTTFGLGWISAVFDNIPLTQLALIQGGYDWGLLAFAVGFGGSILWFGSSAGVALSGLFPQVRYTRRWITHAWFVPLAYIAGFSILLAVLGWNP